VKIDRVLTPAEWKRVMNNKPYQDASDPIYTTWYGDKPSEGIDGPPGGSTPSQYGLPKGAIDLQDLIEYREMNFALGNIFKACYRMGSCKHSDKVRELNKIIWFANRELEREQLG